MIELRPLELKWMEFARATLEMSLRNKIKKKLDEFEGQINSKELQEKLVKSLHEVLRTMSPFPSRYDSIIEQLRDMEPPEYEVNVSDTRSEDFSSFHREELDAERLAQQRGWTDRDELARDMGIPERY